eukprot:11157424-Lingulodinium_polyedra.AAC.1
MRDARAGGGATAAAEGDAQQRERCAVNAAKRDAPRSGTTRLRPATKMAKRAASRRRQPCKTTHG